MNRKPDPKSPAKTKIGVPRISPGGQAASEFILKTILVFFAVYCVKTVLKESHFQSWIFIPILAMLLVWGKAVSSSEPVLSTIREYLTFMPLAYTENELRSDRRLWATYVIILANVFIHYGLIAFFPASRKEITESLMFLPVEGSPLSIIISPVTSMFLHADGSHLWWNMIFLWSFGVVVERRIGWKKFFWLYFATGVIGSLTDGLISLATTQNVPHGFGASGAISGIMGVFMVRLHYKKMVFPIPILGFLSLIIPIGIKVRINSMIVMALFFVSDLTAGIRQIQGSGSNVGYWAHLGSMTAGILLALHLKLQDEAFDEMHLEQVKDSMEHDWLFFDDNKSLQTVLDRNPENTEALLLLARKKSRAFPTEAGKDTYKKTIGLLLKTDPGQAAEVFIEYSHQYRMGIDPERQYAIASVLYRKKDLHEAARTLEMLADDAKTPPAVLEKSLGQLIVILEKMKLIEPSRFRMKQYIENFPALAESRRFREELNQSTGK